MYEKLGCHPPSAKLFNTYRYNINQRTKQTHQNHPYMSSFEQPQWSAGRHRLNRREKRSNATKLSINYGRADWKKINNELSPYNWHDIYNSTDVEFMSKSWNYTLNKIVLSHTPCKLVLANQRSKPWMTLPLKKLINKKDREYRRCIKSKLPYNNAI